jgi:Protein of unknwon function (DUF3310)
MMNDIVDSLRHPWTPSVPAVKTADPAVKTADPAVKTADPAVKTADPATRPAYYTFSEHEPIKVIRAWGLSFALGNVVKYVARAGRKDPTKRVQDLKKARVYLDDEIAFWEGQSKPAIYDGMPSAENPLGLV